MSCIGRVSNLVGELPACAGVKLNPGQSDCSWVTDEMNDAEVWQCP